MAPLVNAELVRRYPDRARMRPTEPAGFRQAWDIVERLWDGTVAWARGMDLALLHESVDAEWSFIETLRHLVFQPTRGCGASGTICCSPSGTSTL